MTQQETVPLDIATKTLADAAQLGNQFLSIRGSNAGRVMSFASSIRLGARDVAAATAEVAG